MEPEAFRALCEETRYLIERRKRAKKRAKKEAALSEQPKDPVARAHYRMDTAAKKGGHMGMVKALRLRVQKTTDPGKLQGIAKAMDELIKDLTLIKTQALRKA